MTYRHIGPVESMDLCSSEKGAGNCPSLHTTYCEGLCPKTPLKKAGILIDPPMSLPIPKGDAAAA